MLINKLEGFKEDGHNPNDLLEKAIFHCWDSVYAPDVKPTQDEYNFVEE